MYCYQCDSIPRGALFSFCFLNILNVGNIVGLERTSYTIREGSGRVPICVVRLNGTATRQLMLDMTALPEERSQGNASSMSDGYFYN